MQKILIIDPEISGHHGPYLKLIIAAASKCNVRMTLATSDSAMQHPAMEQFLGDIQSHECEVIVLNRDTTLFMMSIGYFFPRLLRTQVANYRFWKAAHKRVNDADFVFVASLDGGLHLLSLLGSPFGATWWTGIAMSAKFHFPSMNITAPPTTLMTRLKEILFLQILRQKTLCKLVTIDESLPAYIAQEHKHLLSKLHYLADPNEIDVPKSKCEGREVMGLPTDKFIILLFGSLSLRKGVNDLLNSVISINWPPGAQLLLAGLQDAEVLELMSDKKILQAIQNDDIRVINRFITKEERNASLAACDAVWCGYRNFLLMSGVLVLAGIARKPVISSQEGLIGWLTKKYNCGLVLDNQNPATICSTISTLLNDPEQCEVLGANGAMGFANHTNTLAISSIAQLFADCDIR